MGYIAIFFLVGFIWWRLSIPERWWDEIEGMSERNRGGVYRWLPGGRGDRE
jgi:hypothetical protein